MYTRSLDYSSCKIMSFTGAIMGLGLFVYILL